MFFDHNMEWFLGMNYMQPKQYSWKVLKPTSLVLICVQQTMESLQYFCLHLTDECQVYYSLQNDQYCTESMYTKHKHNDQGLAYLMLSFQTSVTCKQAPPTRKQVYFQQQIMWWRKLIWVVVPNTNSPVIRPLCWCHMYLPIYSPK